MASAGQKRKATEAPTNMAAEDLPTLVHVSSTLKDSIQSIDRYGCNATTIVGEAIEVLQLLHVASSTQIVELDNCHQADRDEEGNRTGQTPLHALAGTALSAAASLDLLVQRVNKSRKQSKTSSGHAWKALAAAVTSAFGERDAKSRNEDDTQAAALEAVSRALAALAVGVALSVNAANSATAKMVASAVLPGDRSHASKRGTKYRKLEDAKVSTSEEGRSEGAPKTQVVVHAMARDAVLGLLHLAVDTSHPLSQDKENEQKDRLSVNLHIVAMLESGFKVGELSRALHSEKEDVRLAEAVGRVVDVIFGKPTTSVYAMDGFVNGDGRGLVSNRGLVSKEYAPPALSLVANTRPWNHVKVEELVRRAAELDLWYSAELLCDAAVAQDDEKVMMAAFLPRGVATEALMLPAPEPPPPRDPAIGRRAASALVDITFDGRLYRRADAFASKYYSFCGPERYAEARFLHACDTITKVIQKRQAQIVDKQIERVDKMVAKVRKDVALPAPTSMVDGGRRRCHEDDIAVETMSDRIREFAFRRLRAANMHAAASRLAKLWGKEYVDDPAQMEEELRARKLLYLQWNDVGCPGHDGSGQGGEGSLPLPTLISDPAALLAAFPALEQSPDRTVGFDCEWHDSIQGVALLQLSTVADTRLLDIPALTATKEGCDVLRATVGRLFSRAAAVDRVIGFSCREDIKRLRASPCLTAEPWFPSSDACSYEDLRALIANETPHLLGARGLRNFGLSRACEVFLGKRLDKAEQCSDWSARPLSREQLEYGALDAFVCAAIAAKISKEKGKAATKNTES